MFRKKESESEAPAGTEGVFRRPPAEGVAKSTPPSELPRRKVDLPGPAGSGAAPAGAGPVEALATVPGAGDRPEPERFGGKRLIVGEGIRLSGEISSCDRLVVEGEVEVTLNDTLALEISNTGRFTGGCEVEEADISGVYEGDLTVRRRLFVRSSGKLTGTIRYGEIELERGGRIAGSVSVLENVATSSPASSSAMSSSPASERGRSPLFSGAEEEKEKA